MYKRFLPILLCLITLLITACGNKGSAPVVRAQPDAQGGISSFQVGLRTEFRNEAEGLSGRSPAGIKASYMFREEGTLMRLDIPGGMFPDQLARVVLFDEATGSTRSLLKKGLQPDPVVTDDMLEGFDMGANLRFSPISGDQPFKKMSADEFLVAARAVSFDLAQQTPEQIKMTQTRLTPMGDATMTIYFDTSVGAVTEVSDVITNEDLVQISESEISYTEVEGIEESLVPYEIKTVATTELLEALEPMELPIADETIELEEGEEPLINVPEGFEIVEDYELPPGEGTVDLNTTEVEHTILYEDIKINELSEDFFLLGAEQ